VLWVRKSRREADDDFDDPLLGKHIRCSTADDEDAVEQQVEEARTRAMLAVEEKVQVAETEARRQAMAEAEEEVRRTRELAEERARDAKAKRIATKQAKKQARAAAAIAIEAAARVALLAVETEAAIVCEFDAATGFALNQPARAMCVARWKKDVSSTEGLGADEGGVHVEVRLDFNMLSEATSGFAERHLIGTGGCCHVYKGSVYGTSTHRSSNIEIHLLVFYTFNPHSLPM
jgi:hypothetical protein